MLGAKSLVTIRQIILFLVILAFLSSNIKSCNGASFPRAPSVFRSDEVEMHRYSAVLAATEPFRIQCQQQLNRALNPVKAFTGKLFGKTIFEQGSVARRVNRVVDNALIKFEQRMQSTLRAYGMTTAEFNSISSLLNEQKSLKKRVLLQAYFYKIAADLEMNLRKAMPTLPSLAKERGSVLKLADTVENNENTADTSSNDDSDSPSSSNQSFYSVDESSNLVKRFARSLTAIENERVRIRNQLKKALNIRELPPKMADPEYLPAMAPIVQRTCKDFPSVASNIIQEYGLHVEEFNALQEKLQKNFFFRYQVMNEINKIQRS